MIVRSTYAIRLPRPVTLPPADANASTGHGVFGSIQGALDSRGGVAGKTFLVKGTGKVGSVTAQLLAGAGGRVLTYDINAAAADIPGCENVSHMDWRDVECDVFVPCSVSGFINEDVASRLKCSLVIGASNVPFADGAALSALLARGIDFVPEAVSSAGAVLGDSIELYAADAYRHARPSQVYAFVRSLTRQKTRELFEAAAERGRPAALCLGDVEEDPSSEPCGTRFRAFVEDATEEVDTLVIGAGMAGTAAAYYLTKDAPGHRVAVVESRSVANQWASSHGQSRMYRRMYSDAYFSQMQSRALELWREIEAERGVALLRENGLLFYGETDTGETVEGSVPGARAVMEELGIPHEYFDTGAAMAERWPDMKADEAFQGVFEATAGKIDSSLACRAMVDGAVERGARLYENEAVVDLWIDRKGAMHAATSQGRFFRAGKVVVAAGGWTRRVLQHLNVDMDLEVHSVAYGHYRVRDVETAARMPQWFCFRKKRGELDGGLYFGFPPEVTSAGAGRGCGWHRAWLRSLRMDVTIAWLAARVRSRVAGSKQLHQVTAAPARLVVAGPERARHQVRHRLHPRCHGPHPRLDVGIQIPDGEGDRQAHGRLLLRGESRYVPHLHSLIICSGGRADSVRRSSQVSSPSLVDRRRCMARHPRAELAVHRGAPRHPVLALHHDARPVLRVGRDPRHAASDRIQRRVRARVQVRAAAGAVPRGPGPRQGAKLRHRAPLALPAGRRPPGHARDAAHGLAQPGCGSTARGRAEGPGAHGLRDRIAIRVPFSR